MNRVPRDKRVYIDESEVHTYVQRAYARAPRGEVVEDGKPGKRFDRVNVIGALCAGKHYTIECYRHTASSVFFERWFEEYLLKEIPKEYTIIMENASFHSKARLRKLAISKVLLLFLPPYSPDYNSIEKSWANMKRFLTDNLRDFQSLDSTIYSYFNVPVI